MARLANRTVVLTGGAQGIGATYALAIAAEGARVCICDVLDPSATVESVRRAGGEATGETCDISDAEAVTRFVRTVSAQHGRIDGLVNNAAIFSSIRPRPFEQISSEEFDRVMQVNVRGSFECIRAVMPAMRAQRYGKIVNIASGTLFKGTPGLLHYTASKGAVVAMTRVIARETGGDGICVNCLAPGFTMSEGVVEQAETEALNRMIIPTRCLQRKQMPEDLTGALLFLLSAESDFMTGQTLVVDGGSVMH